jgi:hypothetical protein
MEITEERLRQIIEEELDKRYACGYQIANIEQKARYFPIGVLMTKEQLNRRNSEELSKTAVHAN